MPIQEETAYQSRFENFAEQKLFRALPKEERKTIRQIGFQYRLTFQELQRLVEITRDLSMWEEEGLETLWALLEEKEDAQDVGRKKKLLASLKAKWQKLLKDETRYPLHKKGSLLPIGYGKKRKIVAQIESKSNFGPCPVASEKTHCCNLWTIDAVEGCAFGCSYCSIQTFYDPKNISVDGNLSNRLKAIKLDPQKRYHIGSGQSSDSLAFGNKGGVLDAQFEFAQEHPNVIWELKTKSKNIGHFLTTRIPRNVFVSWSINPQTFIDHEEQGTASVDERLESARKLADCGIKVGFHFHPIVHYQGWSEEYPALIERIIEMFLPNEIAFISLGTLTFTKPVIKTLRFKGQKSKILQMEMQDASGKLSYPFETKEKLFQRVWEAFIPWHKKVFFYCCMEDTRLWDRVFGFHYETNLQFENALFDALREKLEIAPA